MAAILVIAAVVALVWGAVVFLRGGPLAGCLMVLLAGVCFGHPFFSIPCGPLPLTLDRVLWVVLVIQFLAWRRLGLVDRKPLGKPEIVLLAFFAVLVASTFLHDWHVDHGQPVSRLVLSYVMPLGLYWIARESRLSERAVLALFGLAAALGIYLAVTALAETHQVWWLVYPKYMASSADYPEFFGRGRGPLLNPAGCGLFQGVCLVGLLLWWPRLGRLGRMLLLLAAAVLCLGIYSTLTRSAWMGAGLGVMLWMALTMPRSWRAPLVGAAVLVGVLLVATQWERLLSFKRDRHLDAQAAAESVKLRPIMAVVAWHMFLDRPLTGCGLGQYRHESAPYFSDRTTDLPLEKARRFHQHNVVLSLLVETGLLGAGLFLLLFYYWVRDAWRLHRSTTAPDWARQQAILFLATVAGYFANGMFQDMSLISMANMLMFFMAGLTAGLRPWTQPQYRDVRGMSYFPVGLGERPGARAIGFGP